MTKPIAHNGLMFANALPNVYRAEHGRHAFEVYALSDHVGHTNGFEARLRLKNSNRLIEKATLKTREGARNWLRTKATEVSAGSSPARHQHQAQGVAR